MIGARPFLALADGFRNPFQSVAAMAQGNAFAAQADDASAVFYNPTINGPYRTVNQALVLSFRVGS